MSTIKEDMQEVINNCRHRAYELLADLDSVEMDRDLDELSSVLSDAGCYFTDAVEAVTTIKGSMLWRTE